MSFTYRETKNSNDVHFDFSGTLDENANLPLTSIAYPGNVTINLKGVNLFNSLGCRNWAVWIKDLKAQGRIALVECSPAVIGQLNVLKGFVPPNVGLDSFYVPYQCNKCNSMSQSLVQTKDAQAKGVQENLPCERCGGVKSMIAASNIYLNFLRK